MTIEIHATAPKDPVPDHYAIAVVCRNCDTGQTAVIPIGKMVELTRSSRCVHCGVMGELRKAGKP